MCRSCLTVPDARSVAPAARAGDRCLVVFALLCGLSAGCGRHGAEGGAAPGPSTPQATTPPSKESTVTTFRDVTQEARLTFTHQLADGVLSNIMESDGAGGTILDYDGDGWMDVYLVNSGPDPAFSDAPPGTARLPNRLFRNLGNGTFADVTEQAGVAGRGFGTTAAAADYDNDGDTDLLVVNFGSLVLYRNRGDGTFEDHTQAAGLGAHRGPGIAATFLDADLDGKLDLFVGNYLEFDPAVKPEPGSSAPYPGPLSYPSTFNVLYRNRGDGAFEDISEAAGIRIPGHRAMGVAPFDYDGDGDQDLYVSNDATANLLLENDGHGRFREVALARGAALNQFGAAGGSMAATIGDADGDGLPDLFVTRFDQPSLYLNSKGGLFEDRITASGILELANLLVGWGAGFLDYDLDGDADLFIINGDPHFLKGLPALLLENQGNARFISVGGRAGVLPTTPLNGRGGGLFDFDNDGRMDVVISTLGGEAVLWRNVHPTTHHWLALRLVGTRGNRDGFGARVELVAGGRVQIAEARCPTAYVFQHDPRRHFGLGSASVVERLTIRWPGGHVQELKEVRVDQILTVREG